MESHDHFKQAMALHQAGRIHEATALYRQILQSSPNDAETLHMMGIAVHQAGRAAEAVNWIRRAIANDPTKPGYHVNLGNALRATGAIDAAISSFRRALALQPALADAWNNLGSALQEAGYLADAVEAHRRALSLRPDFAQAWYNLGGAYSGLDRSDDALDAYDRALRLRPDFEAAQVNRANLLRHIGRQDESIEALKSLVAARPSPVAFSNLIYGSYFHPAYDSRAIFQYLSQWNRQFALPLLSETGPFGNSRDPDRPLRVGYVSPDFNGHPIGRFFLPVIRAHDRTRWEITCYSDVLKADSVTERTRSCAGLWRDVRDLSDAQLAGQIREDRIDILVDLTLHTARNRLLAFARKPAPVQATWLAYPGSSGLTAMDYRVSDPYLDPPGLNDAFYSETTLRLPDCFWCFQPQTPPIDVGPLPARSHGYVTFGCLNNFAKVTAPTIDLWAQVLRQVPASRLLILAPPGSARDRFVAAMQSHGITPTRLQFAGRLPLQQYMELYRQIDVSLDTFPCTAHTTAFDSLWMGVPIVSLYGTTAMSRAGLSVLSNLQMADWVTDDPLRFVELATRAAADLDRLAALRTSLRSKLDQSPLTDAPRFALNIENVYREMWRSYCANA